MNFLFPAKAVVVLGRTHVRIGLTECMGDPLVSAGPGRQRTSDSLHVRSSFLLPHAVAEGTPHSIHQVGIHRFWTSMMRADMGWYSPPLSFSRSLIGCSCCERAVKLSTLVTLDPALRRSSSILKGMDRVTAVRRKIRTFA